MGGVHPWRLPLFFLLVVAISSTVASTPIKAATLIVLPLKNNSTYPDVNWVGDSVAETLRSELNSSGQIVLSRDGVEEGMKRLNLRPGVTYTKATLIKLGQTLGADNIIYGGYDVHLPNGETQLKKGSIEITSHSIDLQKSRDGHEITETGNFAELSRLEEHLSYQYASSLQPGAWTADHFLSPAKLIRLDAKESYIRGLLATSSEQKLKWQQQAVTLEPGYTSAQFELGKLYLDRKEFKLAQDWLGKIPSNSPDYSAARFRMGLASFQGADYNTAANYFREVSTKVPLSEVFNNLGASESRLNQPRAVEDLKKAVDGDPRDPVYSYNLGLALYKTSRYDEAAVVARALVSIAPDDQQASALRERVEQKTPYSASNSKGLGAERLKEDFDETAFRMLRAMLNSPKP
jgi:tetratricopeptide (TPR) repeat protein